MPRSTLGLPLALACALAPARARPDPPRVSLRLDYARGGGGEACPAETALRKEMADRLGYDPFDGVDAARGRVAVVLSGDARGLAAHIERYAANGAQMWEVDFPKPAWHGECAALIAPLASVLRSRLQTAPPAAPPEPAATPEPSLPPPSAAPPAPTPEPPKLPEPDVPNPARSTARVVAIVAYSFAGAFMGLGVGLTIDAQNKENSAGVLAEQLSRSGGGQTACSSTGHASGASCTQLLTAAQSVDTASSYRNASYGFAGVSAAVGLVANIYEVSLPSMVKGQTVHVSIRPSGVAVLGSF